MCIQEAASVSPEHFCGMMLCLLQIGEKNRIVTSQPVDSRVIDRALAWTIFFHEEYFALRRLCLDSFPKQKIYRIT